MFLNLLSTTCVVCCKTCFLFILLTEIYLHISCFFLSSSTKFNTFFYHWGFYSLFDYELHREILDDLNVLSLMERVYFSIKWNCTNITTVLLEIHGNSTFWYEELQTEITDWRVWNDEVWYKSRNCKICCQK